MLLGTVFDRFVAASPVAVATRGLLEHALSPEALDALFENTADTQYTRDLLFSTCVDLMGSVVCRVHRSINAAYTAAADRVGVSVKAVYDKLEHVEPAVSAEVVRHTARVLEPVIRAMAGELPPLLPGYRVKILDGNHLARTQRRLKILRDVAAGPLPGQTLVVLDPQLGLALDVVCCEDGHAQERSLMAGILATVAAKDVWIADRNFCTTGILFGIAGRGGSFIIRQHASTLRWTRESERRPVGRTETGQLFEQMLWLEREDGAVLRVRRITLVLDTPTRDGEAELHLLTNLPAKVADAATVARLYRERWSIEGLFLNLTTILQCEVNTLAYPKAALFGFCMALASGNVYATLKASLRAAHGAEKVEAEVSDYYLADELAGTYRGMMIAIPAPEWGVFIDLEPRQLAKLLIELASSVRLSRFKKHKRGPKKPRKRRNRFTKEKHIATARLLNGTMKKK
jgi:IS4 transposase